jgi:UDP-3-O-[3-hydroxymyristoyl] glucosamine N-acyltransferase
MQISAKALAEILQGTIEGDPDVVVEGPSKIEEGKVGTISFLANPKYEQYAYSTQSSILLVAKDFVPKAPVNATLIRVEDVYASVAALLKQFGEQAVSIEGVDEWAFVDSTVSMGAEVAVGKFSIIAKGAKIGKGTIIYPQVYIAEGVEVGANCVLYPGVKIYRSCQIGDNCILHANVVIGSDGFGFAPKSDGGFDKIPQLGNVIIESNVEIGANTVIDRATMGSTLIKEGVKLDNLIQIAHNVEIGEDTAIAAQAGIAGSTKIGKNCLIGGQAGFVGHIQIADGTKVQAQSGINKSIKKENSAIYGSPALPYNDYLRSYAVFRNLPDLSRQIKALQEEIKRLKATQNRED